MFRTAFICSHQKVEAAQLSNNWWKYKQNVLYPYSRILSSNKKELHKLLLQMREQYGQTIIIVTHDKELAEISDRVIEMKDGICAKGAV